MSVTFISHLIVYDTDEILDTVDLIIAIVVSVE